MREYAGIGLRVVVGAIFVAQAYFALFGSTPRGTAAYLAKLGLPVPTILAVLIIAIHGVGGAMLVLGIWTRLVASLNAAILLLGLLSVYVRQGVLLRGAIVDAAVGREPGPGYEYVALLAAATVLVAVSAGGGGSGGRK